MNLGFWIAASVLTLVVVLHGGVGVDAGGGDGDGDGDLGPACGTLKKGVDAICKDFNFPVGVSVKTCQKCKKVKAKCLEWKKIKWFIKVCKKWGYKNVCAPKYPCKWDWKKTKKNVCKTAGIKKDFIKGNTELCDCWGDVVKFTKDAALSAAAGKGVITSATSDLLTVGVKGSLCLANMCKGPPFFGLVCLKDDQDKKQEVIDKKYKDDIMLQLPEIDMELYAELAARIAACATGAGCPLLVDRLKTYIEDSADGMVGGMKLFGEKVRGYALGPLDDLQLSVIKLGGVFKEENLKYFIKYCPLEHGANPDDYAQLVFCVVRNEREGLVKHYGKMYEDFKEIEKSVELIRTGLDLAKAIKNIRQLKDTVSLDKIHPDLIKDIVSIPDTVKDLLENMEVLDDIIPAVKQILRVLPEYHDFVMAQLLSLFYRVDFGKGGKKCWKRYNAVKGSLNEARVLLGRATKQDLTEVLKQLKSLKRLTFKAGIEKYDHYVQFEIKQPRFELEKVCPAKFLKGVGKKLPCLKVPKVSFKRKNVPKLKLVPGFLPYLIMTDLPF